MEVADFEFLLTDDGRRLLEWAASAGERDPLRLSEHVRRLAGARAEPGQVAAAVTQAVLRDRAAGKFGPSAGRMFFTREGLEQATHPLVSEHRATRLAGTGVRSCVDLGCGIGSDLAAFAAAGIEVTGVERDPVTARVAAANLSVLSLPGSVVVDDAGRVPLSPYDAVFCDPSRRRATARTFDPSAFSPPWQFVRDLLEAVGADGSAARPAVAVVKTAPGLDHALIPAGVAAEWVSLDGDLRELALWAPAGSSGRRLATVHSSEGGSASVSEDQLPADPPPVAEAGRFLYEPDAAVVRSHLVAAVVSQVDGWLLDRHVAYVSSDSDVTTPLARRYRVLEVLPFREKLLRGALRRRSVGTLTIKKRGVSVTPENLRRRLALEGDEAATLVLTRTAKSAQALLVEPA